MVFLPVITTILTSSQNDRSSFEMIFDEISNTIFRFSLRVGSENGERDQHHLELENELENPEAQ